MFCPGLVGIGPVRFEGSPRLVQSSPGFIDASTALVEARSDFANIGPSVARRCVSRRAQLEDKPHCGLRRSDGLRRSGELRLRRCRTLRGVPQRCLALRRPHALWRHIAMRRSHGLRRPHGLRDPAIRRTAATQQIRRRHVLRISHVPQRWTALRRPHGLRPCSNGAIPLVAAIPWITASGDPMECRNPMGSGGRTPTLSGNTVQPWIHRYVCMYRVSSWYFGPPGRSA